MNTQREVAEDIKRQIEALPEKEQAIVQDCLRQLHTMVAMRGPWSLLAIAFMGADLAAGAEEQEKAA